MAVVLLTASLLLVELLLLSADPKIITAKPADTVFLPCRAPDNRHVTLVEWNKPDLGSEEYVFVFRDGHFDPDLQHPSFNGRVDFQDPQMKNGDVSLVLKNVKINDNGTYECRVQTEGSRRKRSSPDDVITTIQLQVEPGQQGGQTGLVVTLGVLAVVLVLVYAAVLVVPLIIKKRSSLRSCHPSDEKAEEPPLI